MKVRVYNRDTAIVTGRTVVIGTYEKQKVDIEVQFTDVFVKTDGTWVLVSGHVSRIKN